MDTVVYSYHSVVPDPVGCEGFMAVKAYDSRLLCQVCGLQTCMLPKELMWEEMAPLHISVIQYRKKGLSQKSF